MSENKVPELKKELLGTFYLYECGHVTDGSYRPQGVLPVGRYANILICKHCWRNLQDMFLAGMFRDMIAGNPGPALEGMILALLAKMTDVPNLQKSDPRSLNGSET